MAEQRFKFGENWQDFLRSLDEARIEQAVHSLISLLDLPAQQAQPLDGHSFLDLGSGSGLFSLAAYRLGAQVTSIDFDEASVACTQELKDRYCDTPSRWTIRQGSVLDTDFMASLPTSDFVYSWGVLHHTGNMQAAIDAARNKVASGGVLAIALYNDQGGASRRWLLIKRMYHGLPRWLRPVWVILVAAFYEIRFAVARLARLQNPLPFADWKAKKQDRGMSAWHDWVDWIGGLPFEVASPEQIIVPLVDKDLFLVNLKTVGNGWGCNEFVFQHLVKRELAPQPGTPSPMNAPDDLEGRSPDVG